MTVEETSVAVAAPEVVAEETSTVAATTPELLAKILKQIEFYFGDANLPRDKFLQEKIKENDGWVQIAVLATFSRMKSLSEDVSVIAEALVQSQELLEVSEDRQSVRRKTDLPEAQDNLTTSVYVKGFPLTSTLDEIESFLAGSFDGKIQAIRMRRHPKTKEFKGSVFVELSSAEEAERMAATAMTLPEATEPLVLLVKAKYFEQKNAERTAKKHQVEAGEEEVRPFEYTKGCLIRVEGVPEGVSFNDLKEALSAHRPVAFADIVDGVATIRFKEAIPEGEEVPAEIAEFTVGEHKFASRRATEEEEAAFYDAFLKSLKAKSAKHKASRNNKFGGRAKRQRT